MSKRGTSQRFEHVRLEAGIEKHERIILSILLMNMRGAYHYHGLTIIVHLCSGFLAKLSCLRQGSTADTLPGARRPGWSRMSLYTDVATFGCLSPLKEILFACHP